MDELFDTAEKKVLVDMVRLAQKHGMKGIKGDWKEFLDFHDKKFGASLSDPTRRSIDMLSAFLKTFTKEDDLKRNLVDQLTKTSADDEIPEQRLVRLTLEHPQYPSDYSFPSNDEEWVVIKLSKKSKVMRSNAMLAVDCEMVLCEDGSEALVRICVVDRNLQKSMKMLLFKGTILVGHSLNNDLKALKMDHARVIDTALIFKYLDGSINRRPSLNNLCKSVLGYEVRKKGAPHNCLDDACAAMKLVLAKIDNGVDKAIPLVQEDVPESEMAKLLLHRIPNNVPPEELHKVIPADFTIELKPSRKVKGDKYSAFAIFKNPHEAHQAYETVKGSQEKDSLGRPQKLVELKLTTGMVTSLYVRKMAPDDSLGQISFKKRAFQAEEAPGASKMLKTNPKTEEDSSNQCCDDLALIERKKQELSKRERGDPNHSCDHLKEIERLKQELIERDDRLTAQDKIITHLRKRLNSRYGKRRPKV